MTIILRINIILNIYNYIIGPYSLCAVRQANCVQNINFRIDTKFQWRVLSVRLHVDVARS